MLHIVTYTSWKSHKKKHKISKVFNQHRSNSNIRLPEQSKLGSDEESGEEKSKKKPGDQRAKANVSDKKVLRGLFVLAAIIICSLIIGLSIGLTRSRKNYKDTQEIAKANDEDFNPNLNVYDDPYWNLRHFRWNKFQVAR